LRFRVFIVDLRKYAKRLQDALGKEYSPRMNFVDEISDGPWFETVVRELDQMSIDCAREVEKETGKFPKYSSLGTQPLEKAPPTRILVLSLVINYWLGWVNNEKLMDASTPQAFKVWDRIYKAYMTGRELSKQKGDAMNCYCNNTLTLVDGVKKCFRTINERYIKNVCVMSTLQ
jgi:hypothetical protein